MSGLLHCRLPADVDAGGDEEELQKAATFVQSQALVNWLRESEVRRCRCVAAAWRRGFEVSGVVSSSEASAAQASSAESCSAAATCGGGGASASKAPAPGALEDAAEAEAQKRDSEGASPLAEVTPEFLWAHDVGPRRAEVWKKMLLDGIRLKAKTPQEQYEVLRETASTYDSVIRRDINRTLPQEEMFREKNGPGQMALFRLLRALSIRLWDIGYCQSLNFIMATLLLVFPDDEEAAFDCALALLLRHSLVDLYRFLQSPPLAAPAVSLGLGNYLSM
eukprot:TRINITY_DN31807_c0_g1_i2.p1 TRINITY_DN31807_c0_g1~~TRINITY_DN31807_c0_g1_i2.p1  ORF type:complete len:278 (-),score=82.55 TRINITY_DN31807_c0_g1_i2:46-879(-)